MTKLCDFGGPYVAPLAHTPGPDFAIDPNFKLGNSQDTRPGAAGNKVADRGVPNTGNLRQILKRLQLDVVANVTANAASGKLQTGVRQVINLSVGPLAVEHFGDGLSSGHVTSVSSTRSGATFTRLDVVDLCRYSAKSMVLYAPSIRRTLAMSQRDSPAPQQIVGPLK